jgi:hypothetical protein
MKFGGPSAPMPGPLCGDDEVVKRYWNAHHDHPGQFRLASLAPSAEEIANRLEIVRLRREEFALALQLRDMVVRINALAEKPKSGRGSTLAFDIELALQCLNEATNGSVSEARKLFKDRVRPCVDPKSASRRFTHALNVIISPEGPAICAALARAKATTTPSPCD